MLTQKTEDPALPIKSNQCSPLKLVMCSEHTFFDCRPRTQWPQNSSAPADWVCSCNWKTSSWKASSETEAADLISRACGGTVLFSSCIITCPCLGNQLLKIKQIKTHTHMCDNHGYLFLLLKVSSQLNVHYQKKAQFVHVSPIVR